MTTETLRPARDPYAAPTGEGNPVVIIGAGPAGLTAAYELCKHGLRCLIIEKDSTVGGLARTAEYKGYLFDIGGHRFFTKVKLVEKMWRDILGPDLLSRPRLSRIYYRSHFFHYPLEPLDAFRGLGLWETFRCGLSYARARLWPRTPEVTFDTWISNRFGKRLFTIFFKTYTEKVWGMPCDQIQAEWAAQRIHGLSLATVLRHAVWPRRRADGPHTIKTLTKEFYYPRRGPGMMWERTKEIIEAHSSRLVFRAPVEEICWEPGRVVSVRAGGHVYQGSHFISSMPIREFIERLNPPPPLPVREAAVDFNYRDFLTVVLIVRGSNLFPDNWIYIHDPTVKLGRVQNYNNWSADLVPDQTTTCLGLEYFCSRGGHLWNLPDEELIKLGRREIAKIGLTGSAEVIDGTVLRIPMAYPVYDHTYQRGLSAVRQFVEGLPNLQLVGRNGMHRYNNQDHSMLTGMLAARNILGGHYDLWGVNVEAEYHEAGETITEQELEALNETQPLVPRRVGGS